MEINVDCGGYAIVHYDLQKRRETKYSTLYEKHVKHLILLSTKHSKLLTIND